MKLSDLFEHDAPQNLMALAREFKKEFDGEKGRAEWGASMSVVQDEPGSCSMVSHTFIDWLKERDIDAKFIVGHEAENPKWVEAGDGVDAHTAVQIGQHVIDFTARQFDKSLPNPRIIKVSDFEKEWKKVK